ncbi:Protein lkaaear1 [Bulinus truncatus]|nr:Protein lkaaear1 [Bulinus truncatus]
MLKKNACIANKFKQSSVQLCYLVTNIACKWRLTVFFRKILNSAPLDMAEHKVLKSQKNLQPDEVQKLPLLIKSRVMAYHEPPKEIQDAQYNTKKRLMERKLKIKVENLLSEKDAKEKEKHEKLIGQLKAAEARNRLRNIRLRYNANRAQEISHLIACQPVALKAVRLQALVPPHSETKEKGDVLDKFSRQRVEALLNDMQGLLTNRVN